MNKKILYLAFAPILEGNGVAKKILAQRDAFKRLGYNVVFCYFKEENGKTYACLDDIHFYCLGGRLSYQFCIFTFFRKLSSFVKDNGFDALYIRYEKNANAGFVGFLRSLKNQCVRIMEVPTYPYDNEINNASLYRRIRLWEERHYRAKFDTCVDYIVTFTDATTIFGVKTLKISNAVDASSICLRKRTKASNDEISLIGVANLAFWHGYDRLLYGMRDYYARGGQKNILFRIVGEGNRDERSRLMDIVKNEKLENNVVFYGNKSGKELDELFDNSDFAIGCLACHRKNIITVKSLKNVEYAMRGIPFIYSETNDDFDQKPYVLKASADDTPIDLNMLIDYLQKNSITPEQIRNDVSHLTWDKQMESVSTYF